MVSNHLPLDGVPFKDLMSERLGLPVLVDNDSNVAMLAEHRAGAARGADHAVLRHARHRHRRRAVARRQGLPRLRGGGRRARPHRGGPRRARVPGRLPRPRLPRGVRVRQRDRPRGGGGGAGQSGARRWAARWRAGARSPARWSRSWRTTATRWHARCWPRPGAGSALGMVTLVNMLQPGAGARRRRRRPRPATCMLDSGPRGARRARAAARTAQLARVVLAHFGGEAGMIGAAMLALDALTPIGQEAVAE